MKGIIVIFFIFAVAQSGIVFDTILFTPSDSNTFQCFRTPSIIQAPNNDLLVFVEGRSGSSNFTTCTSNSPHKSIVLRKSSDLGKTWGNEVVLFDCKCGSGNECGYPSLVVDNTKKVIWLMYSGGSGTMVSQSSDNGVTWATPKVLEVDTFAKNPSVGHGIQLKPICGNNNSGRLMLPWVCGAHSKKRAPSPYHSCVVYSDDNGSSWKLGASAQAGSRESEIIQLSTCSNGTGQTIYSSERNFAGPTPHGERLYSISYDSGASFTVEGIDKQLVEPVTKEWTGVVASITTLTNNNMEYVLFSDPDSLSSRSNLTLKISSDHAKTWPKSLVITSGPSSYSDMVTLSSTSIGMAFEQGSSSPYDNIKYALIDITQLL